MGYDALALAARNRRKRAEEGETNGEAHGMEFELLDRYLLDGSPSKGEVVRHLLANAPAVPAAMPFYEGMRQLGERTPDLSLLALRIVLGGKKADDERVVQLRDLAARARKGGDDGMAARTAYVHSLLNE